MVKMSRIFEKSFPSIENKILQTILLGTRRRKAGATLQ